MAREPKQQHDGLHVSLGMTNPMDMFCKLRWECSQVGIFDQSNHHASAYSAINAAITAWQLGDWVAHALSADKRWPLAAALFGEQPMTKKFDLQREMRKCEALHACQQIATAGKHFKIDQDTYREGYRAEEWVGNWVDKDTPDGVPRLVVVSHHMTVTFPTYIDEGRKVQKQHGIRLVLADASEWWEATLKSLCYWRDGT